MLKRRVCTLVFAIASVTLLAQTSSFEVASVKANTLRRGIRGHSFPGNRFEATNVPLRDLNLVVYGAPGEIALGWRAATPIRRLIHKNFRA